MSKTAVKLRLGPLPRNEVVRLTISLSTDVKATLDRYAALHTQLHGEKVDAVAIIPHMLSAFIERDRGFKRGKSHRVAPIALVRPPRQSNATAFCTQHALTRSAWLVAADFSGIFRTLAATTGDILSCSNLIVKR